jgi:peptide deformylase
MTVIHHPDPRLREISQPVTTFGPELKELVDAMFAVIARKETHGVGLAAVQLGILQRVIVVRIERLKVAMINPELLVGTGRITGAETCLSFPDLQATIRPARHAVIDVVCQNLRGQRRQYTLRGFPARVVQHEIDHLAGRTLLDHLDDPG